MKKPPELMAINTPTQDILIENLDEGMKKYFKVCKEKIGFIPNVLLSFAFRPEKLKNFVSTYNELMLGESGLSKLEREMIAVVVSSTNHCFYCVVAHGQAVRQLSGDPELSEKLSINYRTALLDKKQKAMLDFAYKLTKEPSLIENSDRGRLREAGFTEEDIFDIADTVAFFNMSNRIASGLDMQPNKQYHKMNR
ncbi:MAG: alkylhydroperoxidase [Alphaproteobacteria bacterium TMED87]|nr:alkylhydroperoxidase [Rhodospirillaceae bacterium]OUV06827.1 MAG: alkylhydroperoxidase [Alphaproteobacteria bacterium TMED87]